MCKNSKIIRISRLSLFQHHQLRIRAVLAVLAHEIIVFVAGDAEATAIAFFHLVAPVGGVVVEEFHLVAADDILHIDERTLQHKEVVDARHILDAQRVDLIDKLLLDGRGGVRELVGGQLPTFEVGVILTKHALVLLATEILAGVLVVLLHELGAELHHLFHGEVAGEGTVLIAVDAVLLVLASVGVRAEKFWGERHSAALTEICFFFHNFSLFVPLVPPHIAASPYVGLIALRASCPFGTAQEIFFYITTPPFGHPF